MPRELWWSCERVAERDNDIPLLGVLIFDILASARDDEDHSNYLARWRDAVLPSRWDAHSPLRGYQRISHARTGTGLRMKSLDTRLPTFVC